MNSWLDALNDLTTEGILVTVAGVEGSGPREPGAKMLVTEQALFDTIGGGHLELCAASIAREMLSLPTGLLAAQRRLERFSLGPALGQCCGGVVHLAFERVAAGSAYAGCLHERFHAGQDSWRLVCLDTMALPSLCDASGAVLVGDPEPGANLRTDCHIVTDAKAQRWLQDPCLAHRSHLMLFGAGHVGAAIVRILSDLPCDVTWVDERDDQFPSVLPANVRVEITDTPEALIAAAAPGVSFLVMTHSHALDQVLAEQILRRTDSAWFGLIGSTTKRALFERRLKERGISGAQLSSMVCPIGIAGIAGKAPGVIAIAVAAQLMQVWEQQRQGHHAK